MPEPNRRPPWRRALVQLHLWIALVLCLPLAMLGLTGSVLVFEHDLARWLEPALWRAGGAEAQAPSAILAAARAAAPAELRPSLLFLPEEAGDAARVRFAPTGRNAPSPGGIEVHLDPASLALLGTRDPQAGLLRQIFFLHANLTVRERSGREAVGWLGVAMTVLVVTGFVLWWPRRGAWAGAFKVYRGARGARLHRELHGAVGIWSFAVFATVSVTGVYLGFPQQLGAAISSVMPARDLRATANALRATPSKETPPLDLDAVVALARDGLGEVRLRSVVLPQRPDQPYRVNLARPGDALGAPLITAFVDPYARRVLERRDPAEFTAGERFMAWAHALHAGEGLGGPWRWLVAASGLLPLLFSITGISLWWLRRRPRAQEMSVQAAD